MAANTPETLLIPDNRAATMAGVARAHSHPLRATGKLPPAVKVGGRFAGGVTRPRRRVLVMLVDADRGDGTYSPTSRVLARIIRGRLTDEPARRETATNAKGVPVNARGPLRQANGRRCAQS